MYDYTILPNTVLVRLDGEQFIVGHDHPNFRTLKDALRDGLDDEEIRTLVDLPKAIAAYSKGLLTVEQDQVLYAGQPLVDKCAQFILSLLSEGHDITRYANFLEDLQKNPSARAREQLWEFVSKWGLFLNDDGRMVLRKALRRDFKDLHSGTFDNSPGRVVRMDRPRVDDDPSRTCSYGLHVCHPEYLKFFGGEKWVEVQVYPRHVVAIPLDHDFTKFRVEEYFVVRELSREEADQYGTAREEVIEEDYYYDPDYDYGEFDDWN